MKTYTRAIRRHHRARLIHRVESFGEWFRDRARKLYNNRKFCTCPICGNPRRFLKGCKRKQLTVQELRLEEQMRADERSIEETSSLTSFDIPTEDEESAANLDG